MGHDLDDDELKATRNKFYKLNKDDFDKNHVFIISDGKKKYFDKTKDVYLKDLNKYIKILQNIYEHCDIFDVDDLIEITNYMIDQEFKIKELKDEINEMWSHIPRLD